MSELVELLAAACTQPYFCVSFLHNPHLGSISTFLLSTSLASLNIHVYFNIYFIHGYLYIFHVHYMVLNSVSCIPSQDLPGACPFPNQRRHHTSWPAQPLVPVILPHFSSMSHCISESTRTTRFDCQRKL